MKKTRVQNALRFLLVSVVFTLYIFYVSMTTVNWLVPPLDLAAAGVWWSWEEAVGWVMLMVLSSFLFFFMILQMYQLGREEAGKSRRVKKKKKV